CWRIMTPSLRGGSISLGYLLKTYTFNCTYERAALEPNLNSVSASLSLVLHWTRRDLPSLSSI
ncbi:hypothetical protein CbuRSA514_02670, partial [Coxiella burnetii]